MENIDFDEIKQSKEKLNKLVDTTINGVKSIKTTLCEQAQEAARKVVAELKRTMEVAKTIPPKIAEMSKELSDITDKITREGAKLALNTAELEANQLVLQGEQMALEEVKQLKSQRDKVKHIVKARKKAHGEDVGNEDQEDDKLKQRLEQMKEFVQKQEEVCQSWQDKVDENNKNINEQKDRVKDIEKQLRILQAQLTPDISLAAAKAKKAQALLKVQNIPLDVVGDLKDSAKDAVSGVGDSAKGVTSSATNSTKNTQQEAQKELEEIEEEVQEMQAIADEAKENVEQIQEEQSSKMDMLKAEYQQMEYGTQVLTYLITNMGIQIPLPSFIGTGSPNPARTIADGNVSYGLLFFILSVVKASAMRFKALANELNYTPTVEMETLTMIPILEGQIKAMLALGPAGATLGV